MIIVNFISRENRRERTKGVCSKNEEKNLFSMSTGEKMRSNGLKL